VISIIAFQYEPGTHEPRSFTWESNTSAFSRIDGCHLAMCAALYGVHTYQVRLEPARPGERQVPEKVVGNAEQNFDSPRIVPGGTNAIHDSSYFHRQAEHGPIDRSLEEIVERHPKDLLLSGEVLSSVSQRSLV